LVSERETEKYFEFKQQSKINERDIILSRVHKSGYFIPQFDKFRPLDTLGIIRGNLTKKGIQEFVESLWSSGSIGFVNLFYLITTFLEYIFLWFVIICIK